MQADFSSPPVTKGVNGQVTLTVYQLVDEEFES